MNMNTGHLWTIYEMPAKLGTEEIRKLDVALKAPLTFREVQLKQAEVYWAGSFLCLIISHLYIMLMQCSFIQHIWRYWELIVWSVGARPKKHQLLSAPKKKSPRGPRGSRRYSHPNNHNNINNPESRSVWCSISKARLAIQSCQKWSEQLWFLRQKALAPRQSAQVIPAQGIGVP